MMISSGDDKPFAPLKPKDDAVPSTSSKPASTPASSSGTTKLIKNTKTNEKEGDLNDCLDKFEAFLSDLESDVKKSAKKDTKKERSRSRSRHKSERESSSYDSSKYYSRLVYNIISVRFIAFIYFQGKKQRKIIKT